MHSLLLLCFLLLNGKNISSKANLCTITALDNKATLAREWICFTLRNWKQIPILSNSKIILWTIWKFQKLWKRIPSSSSSSRGTRTPSLPLISAQMGNRWNRTCFFVSSKRSTTALGSRRSLSKWVTYSFVRWFHLHWTTVSCSGNFSLQTQRHTGVLLCYLTPFWVWFRIFEPFAAGTLGTLDQSWTFSFLGQEAWLLLRREIPQSGFGWRTWKETQQS